RDVTWRVQAIVTSCLSLSVRRSACPGLGDRLIDVAEGDKIPRKRGRGPGVTESDLLVIKKIDLGPHVRPAAQVMEREARGARRDRPLVFTNCFTGEGSPVRVRLAPSRNPVSI